MMVPKIRNMDKILRGSGKNLIGVYYNTFFNVTIGFGTVKGGEQHIQDAGFGVAADKTVNPIGLDNDMGRGKVKETYKGIHIRLIFNFGNSSGINLDHGCLWNKSDKGKNSVVAGRGTRTTWLLLL